MSGAVQREAPASGATVAIVLGVTALVVVGLWSRGEREPARTARAEWMSEVPVAAPAPPPPVPAPREPVTEPVVRIPTELVGEGGTSALDVEQGRLSVRDASGRLVYDAALSDLVRSAVAVNPPDPARRVAPSVDLADGRRLVVSDEVWLRLPLERRYTHETGPPAVLAPRDAAPAPTPLRRGP